MPSTTSSKSAIKFFHEQYFAADTCAPLHRKLNAIYVALDSDPLTTPEQMDVYYDAADEIRDVLAEAFRTIDAAAALENEREAKRLAADYTKRVDRMIADYKKREPAAIKKYIEQRELAEAARQLELEEQRQAAIEQHPKLAGRDDFLAIGGLLIADPELLEPNDEPATEEEQAEWNDWHRKIEADRAARLELQQRLAVSQAEYDTILDNMNEDGTWRTADPVIVSRLNDIRAKLDAALDANGEETGTNGKTHDFEPAEHDRPDPHGGWADPIDLWGKLELPAFPRGKLPQIIEDFSLAHGGMSGSDPSGYAIAGLVVCAAAIPDRVKLQMKVGAGWKESARLWAALIGDPSVRKTPIIDAAAQPYSDIDLDLQKRSTIKEIEFQDSLEAWKQRDKKNDKNLEKPERPVIEQICLQDTTVESAQDVMRDNTEGVLLIQDELSGWFGAMEKYGGPRGSHKDRGFWLQSYNGGPFRVNRVSRGRFVVPNLSTCMIGGIQPDLMRKFASESTDDGFLQRIMPVTLRPKRLGRELKKGEANPLREIDEKYTALIPRLREPQLSKWHTGSGEILLEFDDQAQLVRRKAEEKFHNLMQITGFSRKLASAIGKYDGLFGRLCVTFHCIEHASAGTTLKRVISSATAERVLDFMMTFVIPHAFNFYNGVLGLAGNHDRLANIAGFMLAHRPPYLNNRIIARGDASMRELKGYETQEVCEQFEALGWVTREPPPLKSHTVRWKVNPRIFTRFAERAELEAKSRADAQRVLKEIFNQRTSDNGQGE